MPDVSPGLTAPPSVGGVLTPDFTIFTAGMVPVEGAPPERPQVQMIGSSTEQDLHHDIMAASALEDMINVPQGLLIWLNHDYNLPDSLFGSLVGAPRLLPSPGGVTDLWLNTEVEMESPLAARTYRYIQNGRRIGCSIGCQVLDYELVDSNLPKGKPGWDQPVVKITHVRTMEWSVVGVPANQRSWVENAINGLFRRVATTPGREDEALRLAPIAKGLFPRDYKDLLNSEMLREARDYRQALKSVQPRPTLPHRVLWEPESNTYFIAQHDLRRAVSRESVVATMETIRDTYTTLTPDPTAPDTLTLGFTLPEPPAMNDTSAMNDTPDILLTASASEEDKKAQEARSKKYGIGIKEGGNVTKPSEWADVPDSLWGDPVNYRYPAKDKTHADNAAARWGSEKNRDQYTPEEQKIIGDRIAANQRHFGEDPDKGDKKDKSTMPQLLASEVSADGVYLLETYDDGTYRAIEQELQAGATEPTVLKAVAVDADGNHEPYTGRHLHLHKDAAGDMHKHLHYHDDDSSHKHEHDDAAAGEKSAEAEVTAEATPDLTTDVPAAEVDVTNAVKETKKYPDASDVDADDDGTHVACMGMHSHKVADPKSGEMREVKHQHDGDASHEGVLTAEKSEQAEQAEKSADDAITTPEAPAEIVAPVTEAINAVDPQKTFLLNTYNAIGAQLGFHPVDLANKAASLGDEELSQVRFAAKAIDDNADLLLRMLGVPDDDDAIADGSAGAAGAEKMVADLTVKSGKTISAATAKRLQIAHDVLAEMSGGLHCQAFVAKNSDAPAEMSRQEQDEKDGAEAIDETSAVTTVTEVRTLGIGEDKADLLVKSLDGFSEALNAFDLSGAKSEAEALKSEVALARKALVDIRTETAEAQATLKQLTERGLGRPTQTFGMRETPQGRVTADVTAGVTGAPDLGRRSDEAEKQPRVVRSLREAFEATSVEYLAGVGRVRRWPAMTGKSVRPPLDGEQMSLMSPRDIAAYYNNAECVVPVVQRVEDAYDLDADADAPTE